MDDVSSQVRKRFKRFETYKRKAKAAARKREALNFRIEGDELAAERNKIDHLVKVAQAEGRKFIRVWISPSDEESVLRWARRAGYKAFVVKEGKDGDIQVSLTGLQKVKK